MLWNGAAHHEPSYISLSLSLLDVCPEQIWQPVKQSSMPVLSNRPVCELEVEYRSTDSYWLEWFALNLILPQCELNVFFLHDNPVLNFLPNIKTLFDLMSVSLL